MKAKFTWTKEQEEAIYSRGSNILVAAAAGAGKTAVLVQRIIESITDPDNPRDIDRLLVMTFTKAAASEMRERINEAISKALDEDPDSELLKRQSTLLSRAKISTIHSFCLELIRNNFHRLDIDPNFRIADETEIKLLKHEVLEELLEDEYMKDPIDRDFLSLVESYSGNRDDREIGELILNIYDFVQSSPWPEDWLDYHSESFNPYGEGDFSQSPWIREILNKIKIEIKGLYEGMNNALAIIESDENLKPYYENFNNEKEGLARILSAFDRGYGAVMDEIENLNFKGLSRYRKGADISKANRVKAIRDQAKTSIEDMKTGLSGKSLDEIRHDLKVLYPIINYLVSLVKNFKGKYQDKKRQKGILDYSDQEHMCLEILYDQDEDGRKVSSLALALRDNYDEILIDEYQDTNLIQEAILNAISLSAQGGESLEKGNLFMVGDVKQSIYRFRQSRPELFLEKYASYQSGDGVDKRKIKLFKNFRSRKTIIEGVNFIFNRIMSYNVGELDYDDGEALIYGANYPAYEDESQVEEPIELIVLETKRDEDDGERLEKLAELGLSKDLELDEPISDIAWEARLVASKIRELINKKPEDGGISLYDKKLGAYRALEYRDIVILSRTTTGWSDIFEEELEKQDIPAFSDTKTGYFKALEVRTILALLEVIDNPLQDIPLLALLRSPMEAWTAEELIDVRLKEREGNFYDALLALAEDDEHALNEKALDFINRLDGWRDKAVYLPTDELIWYLYGETGYYSFVGALPGGAQRQANLRILFERARIFEETSYRGLFNFINFIDSLKERQGDLGSAKLLGENENVVRIMSIHKSKGLEFPLVFLIGCGKRFNLRDSAEKILLHQDLGFGPEFVDYDRRIRYPSLAKEALKRKILSENISEEMRTLYVALTRAKEKLILTGTTKNIDNSMNRWLGAMTNEGEKLSEYQTLKARTYFDWIIPALSAHEDLAAYNDGEGIYIDKNLSYFDESQWDIRFMDIGGLQHMERSIEDESRELRVSLEELSPAIKEEIDLRLDYIYPYDYASQAPAKLSVTELKRIHDSYKDEEEYEYRGARSSDNLIKRPSFMEREKEYIGPAEKGSILHFVLQHLDFVRAYEFDDIKEQVDDLIRREFISEDQAASLEIHKIKRFLKSDLGRRLSLAEELYKETPFILNLPLNRLEGEAEIDSHESFIIQGIIDCHIVEDDGIVLVDYKTDYVDPVDGYEIIKERYRIQMEYYSKALETILEKPVKEKYIYLFWNGEIISY